MKQTFALRGNLVYTKKIGTMEILEQQYLVCEDGRVQGIYPELPQQFCGIPVEDMGDRIIIPGLTDLHVHAPQYSFRGLGMDLELLDWLNTNTFPEESKYRDPEYARKAYDIFVKNLTHGATTRACVFATIHNEATLLLMDRLEEAGIAAMVGKVNMDRNGAPGVLEETTEESMRETLRWLDACQDFRHIKPILTPRFTPSCTNELMAFLGKLAAERDLPVQSHLSENGAEMDWVRQLHPDCRQYWETYKKYGLWNDRTVMAHCVWSDERERQAMKDAGVTVVHCADSNQNLCSGVAPVRRMLDEGVKVALGSDIAGGDHLDLFDVTAAAIRASKARRMMDDWSTPFLTVAEGWYLATSAGEEFFGEQPGFAAGNSLHAIVLADDTLPQPRTLTPAERLERAVYRRQEGAVQAVWSAGRKIYAKP